MSIHFFPWTVIVSLRPADGGSTSASSAASPQASNTSAPSPGATPSSTAGSTGAPAQPTQAPNILSESVETKYGQMSIITTTTTKNRGVTFAHSSDPPQLVLETWPVWLDWVWVRPISWSSSSRCRGSSCPTLRCFLKSWRTRWCRT